MSDGEDRTAAARAELSGIREEILARGRSGERPARGLPMDFPRSRTMKWLLSGAGGATAVAVIVALLMVRPSIAYGMLRRVPLPLLGRVLLTRLVARGGAQP